jgi:predicted nucleotidyltransferase
MKEIVFENLAESIKSAFPEIEIAYLFGSSKDGIINEGSDLDIGILVNKQVLKESSLIDLKTASFIEENFHKADVVVLNRANPVLAHEVISSGKRLFERDSELRTKFELKVFKDFMDHKYYQDIRSTKNG